MASTRSYIALPAVVITLLACSKFKSGGGGESAGGDAATASSTTAQTPSAGSGSCVSSDRKVWAKWANPKTGITSRTLGNKIGVGIGVGNSPQVLLFDKSGSGELVKVALAGNSELNKEVKKTDGARVLERVTPVTGPDGKVSAYADYHDEYNDNERHYVSCELVADRHILLGFDGKPLLKTEENKDAGAPAAPDGGVTITKKAITALGRLKIPGAGKGTTAAANPDAGAPAPATSAAAPPEKTEKKKLREIRDCRSFVDNDGYVWAVGNELYGEVQSDDSVKWSMRFFVSPSAGGGYYLLASEALPKEPKDLYTFDAATAGQAADKSFVVSARYRGLLMLWELSSAHKPTGHNKTYKGGTPTRADFLQDGSSLLLLTSQNISSDRYELRFGRINGTTLPASLEQPGVIGQDPSLAEPHMVTLGSQRWLAYAEGSRHDGKLEVIPVDENLKSAGKAYEVAPNVMESALFALDGGKLLVVYLTSVKAGDELVSETLTCTKG